MASAPSPASEAVEIITPREFRIERSLKRGDTTYELFAGHARAATKSFTG
jgi:DNA-binding CsgD family transcriptional regulator